MALSTDLEQTKLRSGENYLPYEEFLKHYMDGEHLEWIGGKVVKMSPVTKQHEDIRLALITLMRTFVQKTNSGTVLGEPYNVKLGDNLPGRAPDIIFISQANAERITDTFLKGAPDLVVEVLSPKTQRIDRNDKFQEYQQAGVKEYWILDPERQKEEFYVRDDQGIFQRVLADGSGVYHSPTISGFWIRTEWLWQADRLNIIEVLREWKFI